MSDKNNKFNPLIDEIEFIDDSIIESTVHYHKIKKPLSVKKAVSIAASFIVVLTGAVYGIKLFVQSNMKASEKLDGVVQESVSLNSCNENDAIYGDADNNFNDGGSVWYDSETQKSFADDFGNAEENVVSISEEASDETINDNDVNFEPSNRLPNLSKKEKIDNLNKLAYYSGWTILRNNKNINLKSLFSIETDSFLKQMGNLSSNDKEEYQIDVSEDIPLFDSIDPEWEVSEEYSELIPIDPGLNGEVVVYSVYELKVFSVNYFKIQIDEKCFLTNQVGSGAIEVMILGVEIKNCSDNTMIVFKNGDKYFSCLLNYYDLSENGDKTYCFTASKCVSQFSIVKIPALENNTFTVNFQYNDDILSEIFFSINENSFQSENDEKIITSNVPLYTHNFANNFTITNTAFGLDEELYKIYMSDVMAGIISPIMPDIPELPTDSTDDNHITSCLNSTYEGKGNFDEDNGFMCIFGGETQAASLDRLFPNEELSNIIKNSPSEITYALVWIKGKVKHSDSKYIISENGVTISLDYVKFTESENYTVLLFELYERCFLDVDFNSVDYSTSLLAYFTTDNEYDYLDVYGIENEDEFYINLYDNGTYKIYKNDSLIYSNEYKYSENYLCLIKENDTLYLEISPIATFVCEFDGMKRIFKLS